MAQPTFSLSWESHKSNICSGLSVLQQNEEFVDMTLAADGHFVKCHQMILALASPYFKDLISSSNFSGRHPVIFLNKISYKTLSAILEYIYLGEVVISIEELSELIQTAKELRIKGLEDMKLQNSDKNLLVQTDSRDVKPETSDVTVKVQNETSEIDDDICYFEVTDREDDASFQVLDDRMTEDAKSTRSSVGISKMDENYAEVSQEPNFKHLRTISSSVADVGEVIGSPATIRYTVSNQGSIQMILNRYLYYLKHSNRNNSQQWRCVDYLNKVKCPAIVVTKNNIVRQRTAAHIHQHHDQRILKKVRASAVYEAIHEAEYEGRRIKGKAKLENIETEETTEIPAMKLGVI